MKKIILMLLVVLLIVVPVFAAGAPEETTKENKVKENSEIRLAIISTNQGNPVFYDLEKSAKDTAANLGIKLTWYAPETADSVKEAEMIEQAANSGVDAIGVVPYDVTLATTMRAVSERGIPVGTINNDTVRYEGLKFACGTPQYDVGHDVGEIAATYLTDHSKTYTVAIVECDAGNEAFGLRIQGFKDALDENKIKYEVLGQFPCDDDFARAVDIVETFTASNPDLDMWFYAGGWPLMVDVASEPNFAAWHAVKGHYCVSVDAFPPMVPFFDAGLCDGVSGQNYSNMGKLAVEYLVKLAKGESLPEATLLLDYNIPFFSTGTNRILPENYKEAFSKITPWT